MWVYVSTFSNCILSQSIDLGRNSSVHPHPLLCRHPLPLSPRIAGILAEVSLLGDADMIGAVDIPSSRIGSFLWR